MTLRSQLVAAGIVGFAFLVAPSAARAAEVHFTGDDVRVTVDPAGRARIEHAIAYRVSGGPLKGFDLDGVEAEAVIDPVAPVAADGEARNAAHVERKSDRTLHVTMDLTRAERGEKGDRGHTTLIVRVGYTVDLVAASELSIDGAMWRLGWTSPLAPEGYDTARVVLDLPAAPTEPRAVAADGTVTGDGRIVTLRRGPERDELEMSRPHVGRGEAASWTARLDPRAFPKVTDPALRPPPETAPPKTSGQAWLGWGVALLAGLGFGAVTRVKSRRFARACAERGVVGEGVVTVVPAAARAWIAGVAFGLAVFCEASDLPAWGAGAIVLAMLFAAHRTPVAPIVPRGPGQWLALSVGEAFASKAEADALDLSTRWGKGLLVVVVLSAAVLGLALRPLDPAWAWLVPLDALAFLAVVVTGSRAQLPPDRALSPRKRLASLHRVLKRDPSLRVSPWARLPLGATTPDELRLLVMPRAAMEGVVGIEVGVAWVATPAGYAPETEVLVRVREVSAAAARMIALAPRRRAITGRKTDERVVRLVPALGSRAGAVALVKRLAGELRDRRKTLPSPTWAGAERRLPVNERVRGAQTGQTGLGVGSAVPA